MPRKKSKNLFRRGNEQKYLKVALYSPRHSSGTNFSFFFLLVFTFTAAVVFIVTMNTNTIVQYLTQITLPQFPDVSVPTPTLPHIQFPELRLPAITLPAVSLPEISLDIHPLLESLSTFFAFFPRILSQLLSLVQSFGLMVVATTSSFFTAFLQILYSGIAVSVALVNNGILSPIVTALFRALHLWQETFFVPVVSAFELYMQFSLILYGAFQWIIVTFINGLIAIGELVYTFGVLVMQLVMTIAAIIGTAVVSLFTAVSNGIHQTNEAIGARIAWLIGVIKPYFVYIGNTFGKTISGFQSGMDTFAKTSESLMQLHQQNAK